MGRRRQQGNILGYALIVVGALILFSQILPPGFWWFAVGAGLIAAGLWVNNRFCC